MYYTYVEKGGGDIWINYKVVIYKQQVPLKVRLNDKAVGRTEFCETQRIIGLPFACCAGILSATGRIIILRSVYFRKCEIIFVWRKTLLNCSTYLSLRYIYA